MKIDKVNISRCVKYVLTIAVCVFIFLTMLYGDNRINAQSGYSMCHSIMTGDFSSFFHAFDWSYGMSIYTIYAIWSIPVWIAFQIMDVYPAINEYLPVLLWYKLLLVVFGVWSIYLVAKITNQLTGEKKSDVALQYLGSVVFVFAVFYIAQCDIIGVSFVLLGVYYCINEKYIRFLLSFMLAITMKYFAIMVFIPILIFKAKKIYKIVLPLIGGLGLVVVTKIILLFSKEVRRTNGETDYYVNELLMKFNDYTIDISGKEIGLFGFFFFVVCVIAYCAKNDDKELSRKRIVWLALAGYMCFVLFYPCYSYWFVLVVPFFIIMMYCNKANYKVNMVLEIVFFTTMIIADVYRQKWIFMGPRMFSYLLLDEWGLYTYENFIKYFFSDVVGFDLAAFAPMLFGIQYASGILFVIINFPRTSNQEVIMDKEDKIDIEVLQWVKIVILYAFVGIALISLYYMYHENVYKGSARLEVVDGTFVEETCTLESDVNCIDGGAWMGEEMSFQIIIDKEIGDTLESDLYLSTYGYARELGLEVGVYVNDEYVGTMKRLDVESNTTLRYLVIPRQSFSDEKIQKITLKAAPKKIEYHGKEIDISLYMEYISLKTIQY